MPVNNNNFRDGKFAKSNRFFLKKHHFVAVRTVTFTKKTCHYETFLRSFCERNVSAKALACQLRRIIKNEFENLYVGDKEN